MYNIIKVKQALPKVKIGLEKYKKILDGLNKTNVSTDKQFQKAYNGFFRVRQRPEDFYKEYYKFMELHKNDINLTFKEVLEHFCKLFNRIEASFSSKLLSIINPNMPVWDEFVLKNLNLRKPLYYEKNRIQKTIILYSKIINWYNDFIKTEEANQWIELFNSKYPNAKITNVKKIDLILWQIR